MKTKTIKGELYKLVVLHVLERDASGVPFKVRIMTDDDKIHLKGGEEFITAFVHAKSLEPRGTQKKADA